MKPPKRPRILAASAAALLALLAWHPSSAKAQGYTYTWTGAIDNNWETNGNWNTNAPAGQRTPGTDLDNDAILFFSASPRTSTYNNEAANTFVASMTFNPDAGRYIITGNSINFDGGGVIINNSPNPQSINFISTPGFGGINLNNNDFDANPGGGGVIVNQSFFTAARGDLIFGTNIVFGDPLTLVLNGAHNIYLNGNISDAPFTGSGQLEVNGPGNVFLNGISTIIGNTNVNGGKLFVNGYLGSMQTYVNPGGTLGGVGVIGGNVVNSGNVAPGNALGTLTVKGNYAQTKLGTLTVAVDGTKVGQRSGLVVGGQATLGGDLRIVSTGQTPRLSVGQKVTVLTAVGGVFGHFGEVDAPPLEKVIYKTNSVAVEQSSYTSVGNLTPNEYAIARALDKLPTTGSHSSLVGFLQSQSLKDLPGDYDRISPDQLTSIFQLDVSLADVQSANLQRRMEDIRYGSHGFSASGFANAGSGPLYSGGLAGPSGNDGKESKEVKEVAPVEDRWGVFITGVGEWVNVTGDDNARGYDMTTGGFTLGADYKVTQNFAVGIDAGYAGTATDLNDHGRVFVNGGKLGLYSTYFTGGFYVDTAANGGYNSYDIRRSGLGGTARSDTDGGEFNLLVATGYDFKVGGFTFGPTASFQYSYTGLTSFGETGSLAPLNFPGQNQDSLRSAFGAKASYDCKFGGVTFRPELSLAWQHEYGDSTMSIDSTMDGAGDLFRTTGPRIGRDSLLVGAGFAILWNERTSTYLYYDGEVARTRYDENSVSGGVRVSF